MQPDSTSNAAPMNEDEWQQYNYDQARLGIEASAFMQSELGLALQAKAQEYRHNSLNALAQTDPEDAATIRRLQMGAIVPALALQLIVDVVNQGVQGEQLLQEAQDGGRTH